MPGWSSAGQQTAPGISTRYVGLFGRWNVSRPGMRLGFESACASGFVLELL